MYYATFKGIGRSDVAVFNTEEERDAWVEFRDPRSLALKTTKENCTFERMALEEAEALEFINLPGTVHTFDEELDNQEWYINVGQYEQF